uniref:UTP--glucose-1-phosphate uridylyltransferase n=1 Tax=Gongylonema pulchrum TaxID=637853 RepID=A0A183DJ21_9BILA
LNRIYDVNVPLVLMNSFNTDEDTKKLLRKYKNVRVDVHTFCQSKYPRISKESLMPIVKSVTEGDLEGYCAVLSVRLYCVHYRSDFIVTT